MMLTIFTKYYPNSKEVKQSHFVMNTFFYTMLEDMKDRSDYVYAKCERILKRKKVNLGDYSLTIIPVNITGSHWFLVAYDHES